MTKLNKQFWQGKRVFLTGHTGFKGSWLSLWLNKLGAKVTGYALPGPTSPSLFELANVEDSLDESIIGNITDLDQLKNAICQAKPEIIIHMAAQPLVRKSYEDPITTYHTNVVGTLNVLEASRACSSIRVILNVTTDKIYENKEWHRGYREDDTLGGFDPYSSSKACSELITSAYRSSFFKETNIKVATARAGNVIGGGDWAENRLIPDVISTLATGEKIVIRSPKAIRPWQHVLEPLSGYLLLCEQLYLNGEAYAQAWNFGPQNRDAKTVEWVVEQLIQKWPYENSGYQVHNNNELHETKILMLDCSKANRELAWSPRWGIATALDFTIQWYVDYLNNKNMKQTCEAQIDAYETAIPLMSYN